MPAPTAERRHLVRIAIIVAFVVAGAAVGLVIQRLVGCPTGHCPITGNPAFSTIYGALIGFVVGFALAPGPHRLG